MSSDDTFSSPSKSLMLNDQSSDIIFTPNLSCGVMAKPPKPPDAKYETMMITTPRGEHYVPQTTMWKLQQLKTYSRDAKALVALAAFTLKYGNLLHLIETSTSSDQLVNSLKQLNQIQNRKVIVPRATQSGVGYITLEIPCLSDALQDIPVAVYWITASIIAAIGNNISVSDYTLSDSKDKLYFVDSKLKEPLNTAVDFQAKKTPETFNSSTDYKNSFMPLLLEGTHSDLYSNLLSVSHAPFCDVTKVERDNKQFKLPKSLFCQISFKSTKECNGKYEPEPGYLIAFTDIKRNTTYWDEVLQYLGLRGNMLIGFLSPDICQLSSLWYFGCQRQ
ncbi:hypothetical protein MTR_8g063020 [Medicago truncatula]|uniref:Sieve element occlusion N-terminal domain-containing protein n=1 Tax=Medicago truncatula TaxID=3880 RepID=G7LFE4_MEDTR|nr:hypothetical protein MTR_8g063020 [Medicago truncatula]